MKGRYKKLLQCIALDAVGTVSTGLPVIDIVWAPIAASVSFRMFGEKRGKYTSVITFVEEILPVTDGIPSFTLFWFLFDFIGIGKGTATANPSAEADFVGIN